MNTPVVFEVGMLSISRRVRPARYAAIRARRARAAPKNGTNRMRAIGSSTARQSSGRGNNRRAALDIGLNSVISVLAELDEDALDGRTEIRAPLRGNGDALGD